MKKVFRRIGLFFRKILWTIIKVFLRPYVVFVHKLKFKKNGFKIPKQAIYVSNHVTNWDGIYVNLMFFWKNIYFVVHDEFYKTRLRSFAAGPLFGQIRRSSAKNETAFIKKIIEAKSCGSNIGLFPEGDIDMWGRSMPFPVSAAKLVKKLRMPVVVMNLTGAHLRSPRWAIKAKKSKLIYSVADIIQTADLDSMTINQVYERITRGISYNEMEWQKTHMVKIRGTKLAEKLEYGLYFCPVCRARESMFSYKNLITCKQCGAHAKYNNFGFFESEKIPFKTTSEWCDWQIKELHKYIDEAPADIPLLKSEKVNFYKATRNTMFFNSDDNGDIELYRDRIVFYGGNSIITFPFHKIEEQHYEYKATLELREEENRYRFDRPEKLWPAYLWSCAIQYLLNMGNK